MQWPQLAQKPRRHWAVNSVGFGWAVEVLAQASDRKQAQVIAVRLP